ncbi:hypothetical protein D9M72_521980 [compost metagenome]
MRTAARRWQHQDLAGVHVEGMPGPDRRAIQRRATFRASQGDAHVRMEANRGTSQREFYGGARGRIAQQPVADRHGQRIHCPAAAHADTAEAGTAQVLHRGERARPYDFDHAMISSATKRTVSPGANRDGGSRSATKSSISVWPISCQPPGSTAG